MREKGALVIIGGAEDRVDDRRILRRFVQLAGGTQAQIVVLTAGTSEPIEAGYTYIDGFERLGADAVQVVDTRDQDDANQFEAIRAIGRASGIFFTGGNQARIVDCIKGTLLDDAIRKRYDEGVVIGGTSAGAAIMPELMIAKGESDQSPRGDSVVLAPGLGFVEDMVLDQHFAQRGRLGRLMAAVLRANVPLGVGIDENTAIVLQGHTFEVLGEGSVTVIDQSPTTHHNLAQVRSDQPITVFGVKLHILAEGCRFNLYTRQPLPLANPALHR